MISTRTTLSRLAALLFLLAVLAFAGCGGAETEGETAETPEDEAVATETAPDQDALVLKIAALADAIEAAPENATDILAEAGLTEDEFKAEIFRISADPVLAHAYEEARGH